MLLSTCKGLETKGYIVKGRMEGGGAEEKGDARYRRMDGILVQEGG